MRVSHNIASLNILNSYRAALASESQAMGRVSSGKKVNKASDDPYGAASDTAFTMQLKSLQMANQNAQDGVSLLQTSEGGLNSISSMLERIQTLATEAANGTENDSDRSAIQLEATNLVANINSIAKSTNINGVNLLDASDPANPKSLSVTIGANVGENISIPTYNFEASNIKDSSGNSLSSIDLTTADGCNKALGIVQSGMDMISSSLSTYGALENRFSASVNNISSLSSNVESGDSDAIDADVAAEMLSYSRASVIVQAGIAMMAQTNKFPQQELNILQNITAK